MTMMPWADCGRMAVDVVFDAMRRDVLKVGHMFMDSLRSKYSALLQGQ